MDVRLLHNHELWNGFLAQQSGQYSYQTFEWGEHLNRQGHIIFRLGAFVEGRLTGVMLLAITRVPIIAPFSLLNLKWMYCYQGPCIAGRHPDALGALLAEAHAIAKREQAIVMRIEAPPDIHRKDASLWDYTLQQLRYGLGNYASDWAKAQGLLRYEMYVVSPDEQKRASLPGEQARTATVGTGVSPRLLQPTGKRETPVRACPSRPSTASTDRFLVDKGESGRFGPTYDFVYRPFFYQLWTAISRGHLPSSKQALQQVQQQVVEAATVPLHV